MLRAHLTLGTTVLISQEKTGLRITALKLPFWQHKSSGLRTSTELLRNSHQVLKVPWSNALKSSRPVSQDLLTRSQSHLICLNVWRSSTLSQLTCTQETSCKVSSTKKSMKVSHSNGNHNSNLNGDPIKTTKSAQDNSADSHGKLIKRNPNVSFVSSIGSDSTLMSTSVTL